MDVVRAKKPIPLEIGLYIGERLAEYSMTQPTGSKSITTMRFRFRESQKLKLGQHCFYYLWTPYARLPTFFELEVIEVEEEREGGYPTGAYVYSIVEMKDVEHWPPGPGYA